MIVAFQARCGFPKKKKKKKRVHPWEIRSETSTDVHLPVGPLAHTPDWSSVMLKLTSRAGQDVTELNTTCTPEICWQLKSLIHESDIANEHISLCNSEVSVAIRRQDVVV